VSPMKRGATGVGTARRLGGAALIAGLALSYTVVELSRSPLTTYAGLASLSLFLAAIMLLSYKRRSYTYLLAPFISIYLVNSVLWTIIDPQPILTWDHKAMANLAEYIATSGAVPRPEQAFEAGSRMEYASYPAPFILWAASSMILGSPPDDLMVSPPLILPLILIFAYALHLSILPKNSEREHHRGGALYAIFGAGAVSGVLFFNQLRFCFIYQNFARYILFLYSSLLFIDVVRGERRVSRVALILMSTLIIFSHSESSIALAIFVAGLLAPMIVSRRRVEARKRALLLLILTVVSFGVYYLWAITAFTKSLLAMIRQMLEFLAAERAEAGLRRYTPYDYTLTDLALLIISALLAALIALDALIRALFIRRRMPLTLIPFLVSGLSMVLLFAFTPYKSDISLKFIYITAICAALLLAETRDLGIEAGLRLRNVEASVLVLTALLVMGAAALHGYTKEPVIQHRIDGYNIQYQLNSAAYPLIYGDLKRYGVRVHIADSPLMPYYYIRDFLEPRGLRDYAVCYLHRDVQQYSILQKNGIFTPRFELLTSPASGGEQCFSDRPLYGFVSSFDAAELGANYSVILSTSLLEIFYAG